MVIKKRLQCQTGLGLNTCSTAFQLCDLTLCKAQSSYSNTASNIHLTGRVVKNNERKRERVWYLMMHSKHLVNSNCYNKLWLRTLKTTSIKEYTTT